MEDLNIRLAPDLWFLKVPAQWTCWDLSEFRVLSIIALISFSICTTVCFLTRISIGCLFLHFLDYSKSLYLLQFFFDTLNKILFGYVLLWTFCELNENYSISC